MKPDQLEECAFMFMDHSFGNLESQELNTKQKNLKTFLINKNLYNNFYNMATLEKNTMMWM